MEASNEDVRHHVNKLKSTSKSLWFIMKMNYPETFHIILGCVASIITGSAIPFYAIIFGGIVKVFTSEDMDYVLRETEKLSLYFLLEGAVVGVATILQFHMLCIAGERLTMRLRSLMFEAILNQEIEFFDRKENGVGSLCSQLSSEAANVQGATGYRIGLILNALVTVFIALGMSLVLEWRLALVGICFSPVVLGSIYLEQKLMKKNSDYESLTKSLKIAIEVISNIRTVASLGCESYFFDNYKLQLVPYFNLGKKRTHFRAFIYSISRNVVFFSYSATFYYGAILVSTTNLDISLLIIVVESLIVGSWSIANALSFSPNFHKGLISANRIFQLLIRLPKIQDGPETFQGKLESIKYEKVHFTYPTRPSLPILRGLDMSIMQGKMVALVGPSGCGKSTIIQLLERFYDPNDGKISINNRNIRQIQLRSLRLNFALVSQEPNLFSRTIAENIAYGDNTREVPINDIIKAATLANIHNFITVLPHGYETKLGEKGTQLSGGQKQRVAIARALVRNPKVLLLDEATSALDMESEKLVQKALDNAMKGRTCISIAHRLSTIQNANVICAINNGRVVEMGTHAELLDRKGLYYKLYCIQSGEKPAK